MKSKKVIATLLSSAIAVQMMGVAVSADLVNSDNGLRFKLPTGEYATGWVVKNENTYYFGEDGYALQGWYKINDNVYFFDKNYVMADGLTEINGVLRYFKDGKMVKKSFVEVGDKTYYVSSTGKVAKGWRYLDNVYYYFNEDGSMETGWKQLNGNYYYFGKDGKMARNTSVTIDGVIYYFDEGGVYLRQEGTKTTSDSQATNTEQTTKPSGQTNTKPSGQTNTKPSEQTNTQTTNSDEKNDKEDLQPNTNTEPVALLPMTEAMIANIENTLQVTLNDEGKQSVNAYVREKKIEAMGKGAIDAKWYCDFVAGAYKAAGMTMPQAKYDALMQTIESKLAEEPDYMTGVYKEIISV